MSGGKMVPAQRVRCAIYTRKSSDEGLEQAFNSLDAQREACAAYILSQASEGWSALPEVYDDGGLSGGTLARPALQRLLGEVAAGRVDIIVVYKVDRLTRSLFDFAKLVETFDKSGTSFVSVTQSFNTITSMGRLTLNMLLSFAQFEREVTAERIRDKIAASKARGMWMGGTPPLGYAPDGRTLAPVEEHAALVRHIVERYLALGNVTVLKRELDEQGITLPLRERSNGNGRIGGGQFARGQLYKILSNPIYTGRIAHGAKTHQGLHPAIVDLDRWELVQARLAGNRQGTRTRVRAASPSLFAGKLVDPAGEPLIATHANKGATRYRYYVSRGLLDGAASEGSRIPALELERAVCERVAEAFDDPIALAATIGAELTPASLGALVATAAAVAGRLRQRDRLLVQPLVQRITLMPHRIEVECSSDTVAEALGVTLAPDVTPAITVAAEVTLTRTGKALRLVQDNGAAIGGGETNAAAVRLLIKARRWWRTLRIGELTITELAATEKVSPAYLTRVLRLAFLSPEATEAVIKGRLRASVDVGSLTLAGPLPACWREQALRLMPARSVDRYAAREGRETRDVSAC
ncbi:recombinase family protein [Sphingomonas bacterium]|uniref:recombinase family protein n=1 Tax=Sphingomonas bacterium TaxID=1895847 RepID=UPI0015765074|nr:recombinase family protein [Sphingomonas bacterium]